MKKILNLKTKNEKGCLVNSGTMELSTTENEAKLYFFGDIANESWLSEWYEEDKCPNDVKEFLDELEGNEKLDIYINSGGGSVFGGLAIYNMLKRHKGEKTVYIEGLAGSIASVIAMVGDKIVMPKNSFLMIHKPMSGLCGYLNADELRKEADTLDICQKSIMTIYEGKLKDNIKIEDVEKMVNAETWLLGEEASQYFDIELVENSQAVAVATQYSYNNAPKSFKKAKISNGKTEKEFDINDYKETIVGMVDDCFKQREEERKAKILSGLELI